MKRELKDAEAIRFLAAHGRCSPCPYEEGTERDHLAAFYGVERMSCSPCPYEEGTESTLASFIRRFTSMLQPVSL